ncbi:sensor histidine kinase [Halopelagius longus]|uniref:histidine kinase n=1 Tax=Halopelagius longus TaxID=1236180 RepID=A0A1H1ADI4_9EURY|nr:PAS domain-containing sensor histidine kinase [Halopelagius longus]RDI70340.1 PAS domain-containing sensor histidine kinase [Halopelagius longus]SDQ37778.1 PAS domain S-box-containing protein [Halopelagius longus]
MDGSDDGAAEGELDEEVYRRAFRSTEAPAVIADPDFVIRDINRGGLDFLGYELDDVVGQPLTVISGDDDVSAEILDSLSRGERWRGQFAVETRNGRNVYGTGSASPIVVDGETKGIVAVFVDTTKQRQYENAAEVLNRLLRHDLRNELNIMYGHIQRAQSAAESPAADESLERARDKIVDIVHKTERARDLRDLLEKSHSASNRPVRLDIVLNNKLVEVMHEYDEAEYEFEVFPEVTVVADDLLPAAVEAVLENAVTHNDAETPRIEVSVDVGDGDVVVSVADNGPGVPESQRDLIFGREEFDQLHHGTGISLFFADSVLSGYNGDIWVEGNDPRGAVFKIRLERP